MRILKKEEDNVVNVKKDMEGYIVILLYVVSAFMVNVQIKIHVNVTRITKEKDVTFQYVSNCVYGVCVEPEIFECFYGYKGDSCEEIISHPLCVHGIESKGDKCICDSGFIGRLCEIKECDSNCDYVFFKKKLKCLILK